MIGIAWPYSYDSASAFHREANCRFGGLFMVVKLLFTVTSTLSASTAVTFEVYLVS